jgi:hypothetical protein
MSCRTRLADPRLVRRVRNIGQCVWHASPEATSRRPFGALSSASEHARRIASRIGSWTAAFTIGRSSAKRLRSPLIAYCRAMNVTRRPVRPAALPNRKPISFSCGTNFRTFSASAKKTHSIVRRDLAASAHVYECRSSRVRNKPCVSSQI